MHNASDKTKLKILVTISSCVIFVGFLIFVYNSWERYSQKNSWDPITVPQEKINNLNNQAQEYKSLWEGVQQRVQQAQQTPTTTTPTKKQEAQEIIGQKLQELYSTSTTTTLP